MLHVQLARDSSRALVIRRGPSDHWAFIGWDRKDDSFVVGQWIKGRLHPKRGDISPDGQHILYFHCNYRSKLSLSAWTAISKWPYVTAVSFHPFAASYHGGGLWVDSHRYWLNDWPGNRHLDGYLDEGLRQDKSFETGHPQYGEDMSVYIPRLTLNGWMLREIIREPKTRYVFGKEVQYEAIRGFRFSKQFSAQWSLHMVSHCDSKPPKGKGHYWDEFCLRSEDGMIVPLTAWDWGDVDGDRLVWAEGYLLWASKVGDQGLVDKRVLRDFTDMKFESIEAPYERKLYVAPPPEVPEKPKRQKARPRKQSRKPRGERY